MAGERAASSEVDRPEARATSADAVGRTPATMTPLASILEWLRSVMPAEPSEDAQAALDELLPDPHERRDYLLRFCTLIALSASIAAFGLLADSGAVVIGAMLVAPLMTPIMGAAGATVVADNRRLVLALLIIALGTALAIVVGYATSLVAGRTVIDELSLPQEIRSRTFPGLLDLGVAITAGAAAGYIQPRRAAISALPGVGIAVALVPPLATVGITAELGLTTEARNAFLLFVTNLAAIIFAAGGMLLLAGFRPHAQQGQRALRKRLLFTSASVLIVAVPLFQHTRSVIIDQRLQSAVVGSVQSWDPEARLVEISADVVDGRAVVELVVIGQGEPAPVWELAEEIRGRFGGPVHLEVLYQGDDRFVVDAL